MKSQQEDIPNSILHDLNEFTPGGFFLMTFDKEGNPKVYSKSDSKIHAVAMQYYLVKWIGALEDINLDNIISNLGGSDEDKED